MSIFSSYHPTGPETTYGPFTLTAPTAIRAMGRQHRFKFAEKVVSSEWRLGTVRFDLAQGGER
jgi:hypothetical protein